MSMPRNISDKPILRRWIDGGATDARSARAAELLSAIAPFAPPSPAPFAERKTSRATAAGPRNGLRFLRTGPGAGLMLGLAAATLAALHFTSTRPSRIAPLAPPAARAVPLDAAKRPAEPAPRPPTDPARASLPAPEASYRQPRPASVGSGSVPQTLDAQARLIGSALRILREDHDPSGAVSLLGDFDRRFPNGELAREAHAVLAEARTALRKVQGADETSMGRGGR
jgi:hypothetical protein